MRPVGEALEHFCQPGECGWPGEEVARIQKQDPLAGGEPDSLIHGIVDPGIGFRDRAVDGRFMPADDVEGAIGGGAVDDEVFDGGIVLAGDAEHGLLQIRRCIADDGDDRYQRD